MLRISPVLFFESQKLFEPFELFHVVTCKTEVSGEQFFIAVQEFVERSAHLLRREEEFARASGAAVACLDKCGITSENV